MTTMRHWSGTDGTGRWAKEAAEIAAILAERAARHDRDGDFVAEEVQMLRERGLTSMLVPEDLGGGGATYAETCAVLAELAHGCPATALTLSMHTHLVAAQVWRLRHDLPAPVLGRVANEGILLVSTGASDWVDSEGAAAQVDGGFQVSGRKSPSSGCPAGDVLVSSARWDDGSGEPKVVHFSVPFTADGVTIEETWDTMGMRATGSHTVVLEEVFVPEAAVSLTRPAGRWHPIFDVVVGAAMPLIMSVYVGVAEAAAERAIELVRSRSDRAVAPALVGRMLNRLHEAQDALAWMVDANDDLRFANTDELAAAMLSRKTTVAESAVEAVRLAMEAAGGLGFSTGGGIERLYRDVHGGLYHPLPAAKQELFSGSVALTGEPV